MQEYEFAKSNSGHSEAREGAGEQILPQVRFTLFDSVEGDLGPRVFITQFLPPYLVCFTEEPECGLEILLVVMKPTNFVQRACHIGMPVSKLLSQNIKCFLVLLQRLLVRALSVQKISRAKTGLRMLCRSPVESFIECSHQSLLRAVDADRSLSVYIPSVGSSLKRHLSK